MSHYDANFDAIVARSTLIPTAGEFVPQANRPSGLISTPNYAENGSSRSSYYSRNRDQPVRNYGDRSRNTPSSSIDSRSWRSSRYSEQRREDEPPSYNRSHNTDQVSDTRNGYRNRRYQHGYKYNGAVQSTLPSEEESSSRDETNRPSNGKYNRSSYHGQYGNASKLENSGKTESRNKNFRGRYDVDAGPTNQGYDENQYRRNGDSTTVDKKSFKSGKKYLSKNNTSEDSGKNQTEVLIDLLTKGTLECLVCCEHVKQTQSTWSCGVCYHVLHLRCVVKWAQASRVEDGWRCPACQHVSIDIPNEYSCFCGKIVEPSWNRGDCPHTCGSVCSRARMGPCPHICTLQCHPGPCPPCQLYQTRSCGCGRASRTVQCTDLDPVLCGSVCGKTLNCGLHKCTENCHNGDCPSCEVIVNQVCFCGNSNQEVLCTNETAGVNSYCCGKTCEKKRGCGNHECPLLCHEGACPPCNLLPSAIDTCPCGETKLVELTQASRQSCLDPIPTCNKTCQKQLSCGEPGGRHVCLSPCHEGVCPPCPGETSVRCRCGHVRKTLECAALAERGDDVRCNKKCFKQRSCGKHKCREVCCIDVDHVCPLPCTRTLSCGLHHCEQSCHSAYCRPCPRVSFEELTCHCGAAVTFPPVPCGTPPPKCTRVCSRDHPCQHRPDHECHSAPSCPPCTALVSKKCHGGHELRKAVLCHVESFSCGLPCGKPLPCGRHSCIQPCHDGPCLRENQECSQPCTVSRPTCGHPCNAPCHNAPCPDTSCKQMVKVTCECGHRYSTRACIDNAQEYQRTAISQLASKMADLAAGQTIDINEVTVNSKKLSYKTLECSEECKVIDRNRRLAIVLQIRNPDLSAKLTPRYSDFLRGWAKKDPFFCQMVHDKLTDLVQLAKQSKQKSRSFSFDPMNRDKRQFVYEYCEHFGCEAVAYDREPKRNIVATALKDKSWLPGVSLLELIQREKGARKVPVPCNSKLVPSQKTMDVLPKKSMSQTSVWALPRTSVESVPQQPPAQVDYFDMTPSHTSNPQPGSSNVDYFDMTFT